MRGGGFRVVPDAERCVEEISEEYLRQWRARNSMTNQCQFRARWIVNGRRMCARHAGELVLDLLSKHHTARVQKL